MKIPKSDSEYGFYLANSRMMHVWTIETKLTTKVGESANLGKMLIYLIEPAQITRPAGWPRRSGREMAAHPLQVVRGIHAW
jgi:hypothetical protein